MAVQAELVIEHHGCVTESFTGETSLAQIGDHEGSALFLLHAADQAALDAALARCEDYADNEADVLDRSPTSIAFRGVNPSGGIPDEIQRSDCSILWPVVYRDGLEHYTLLAPDRNALAELADRLEGHGDVTVRKTHPVDAAGLDALVPVADLASDMTRRQLEALLLADENGYYETPRETSTEELAEAFGVGVSTYNEHLRKAERSVIGTFSSLVRQHDALAKSATKGPGRPPEST